MERFPEARQGGQRHSCPQDVAFVVGDLLGTPLDTNNYFHTCPCLLAFMSPGFITLHRIIDAASVVARTWRIPAAPRIAGSWQILFFFRGDIAQKDEYGTFSEWVRRVAVLGRNHLYYLASIPWVSVKKHCLSIMQWGFDELAWSLRKHTPYKMMLPWLGV